MVIKNLLHDPKLMQWADCLHKPLTQLYGVGDEMLLSPRYKKVAIVGTRHMTRYGQDCLNLIVPELVRHNVVIVSGGALGIDIEAQKLSHTLGGKNITVLGSGLKVPTPRTNIPFFRKFISSGLLVSEFSQTEPAQKFTFVQRNRIISAISDVILVIEAGQKSGALITADFALEQGKTVLAIPGLITSEKSIGTNNLIKSGATLINSATDILDLLNLEYITNRTVQNATVEFENTLQYLQSSLFNS